MPTDVPGSFLAIISPFFVVVGCRRWPRPDQRPGHLISGAISLSSGG